MATAIWTEPVFTDSETKVILDLAQRAAAFAEDEWSRYGASDDDVHPHYGGDIFNEAGEVILHPEDIYERVSDFLADVVGEAVMDGELPEANHGDIAYEAQRQFMLAFDLAALDGEYYDWEGNLLDTFGDRSSPKPSVMGMVLESTLNICETEKRLLSESM